MRWHDRLVRAERRFAGLGPGWLATRGFVAAILLLIACPPAAAQASGAASPAMDTLSVGRSPYSRMRTLLEKTIFKVDVLTLDVHLGDEDAQRIERLLAGGRRYSRELADSIAAVAIYSRDAWLRIEFLRNVSLRQFVDGIDDNLRHVPEAGIIERSDYEMITENLPRWFSFLRERGIHKGDQIHYRIRGDSLRTVYRAAGGEILLDQVDVGEERRLAVLGSYFVRKSDFRKGLIKSLFDSDG